MLEKTEDHSWPSGSCRSIALLDISDSVVELKTGLELVSGAEEGLGEWLAVGGKLSNGELIELIRHIDSPNPSTYEIRIDSSSDVCATFGHIIKILDISMDCINWKVDELNHT